MWPLGSLIAWLCELCYTGMCPYSPQCAKTYGRVRAAYIAGGSKLRCNSLSFSSPSLSLPLSPSVLFNSIGKTRPPHEHITQSLITSPHPARRAVPTNPVHSQRRTAVSYHRRPAATTNTRLRWAGAQQVSRHCSRCCRPTTNIQPSTVTPKTWL